MTPMSAAGLVVLGLVIALAHAYLLMEFTKWVFNLGRKTAMRRRRAAPLPPAPPPDFRIPRFQAPQMPRSWVDARPRPR